MIIHECEQLSDEWYGIKLGKVSASHAADVLSGGKGVTRKKYMTRLAAERLTGLVQPSFHNKAMDDGINTEAGAVEYYEELHDVVIKKVGFIEKDEWVGASPDGLVGNDGLIEIKCPYTTTHITNILNNKAPSEYLPQIQMQLWVSERKWCDFISYDIRLSVNPMVCIRVHRDEDYITKLADGVKLFISELQDMIVKIKLNVF